MRHECSHLLHSSNRHGCYRRGYVWYGKVASEVVAVNFPIGINTIKEMTREELIEELLVGQRVRMAEEDVNQLRALVVNYRLDAIRRNLVEDAGLTMGPMGFLTKDDSE